MPSIPTLWTARVNLAGATLRDLGEYAGSAKNCSPTSLEVRTRDCLAPSTSTLLVATAQPSGGHSLRALGEYVRKRGSCIPRSWWRARLLGPRSPRDSEREAQSGGQPARSGRIRGSAKIAVRGLGGENAAAGAPSILDTLAARGQSGDHPAPSGRIRGSAEVVPFRGLAAQHTAARPRSPRDF